MKLTRFKLILAAVAGVLLAGAFAFSQTMQRASYHGDDMMGGHMMRFFSSYLDLTDTQQAQVKAILAKEKPTFLPLVQQVEQGRRQLRQITQSGNFDEAQARALVASQSQNITELIVQKARVEAELFQVLTPEQKTKLNEFMDKRERRSMKHMQPQSQPAEQN